MWAGAGFGTPSKFIAANGGELANELYCDMHENLDVDT